MSEIKDGCTRPALGIKLTRGRLFEQVVDHLQNLLADGTLQPGERLPVERDLAEQLGLSRSVIREAVKVLSEKGLVRILAGSGTYVAHANSQTVSDSIALLATRYGSSFDHLLETRRFLEVEHAGLAAERATSEDLIAMELAIGETRTAVYSVIVQSCPIEEFVQADLRFHSALAKGTHNPLFSALLEPITGLCLEFWRLFFGSSPNAQTTAEEHAAILSMIRGRDSAGCRELMRHHLTSASEAW